MKLDNVVEDCRYCPCQYDGGCQLVNCDTEEDRVNCDRAYYGQPKEGKVGDCKSGGIPEQCPLLKGPVTLKLDKSAWVNKE